MNASLGRISAHLVDVSADRQDRLVELINSNINPPDRVAASDVYIRAMYLASDEVNSFGGRFPVEELQRLSELIIDSPVLVGHRKDRLPVARTFLAEVVCHENKTWVKSYFYWLKSAEGSQTLRENIDGGIYKECSVGFTFQFPECSVCGEDIRRCEHEPFEVYAGQEGNQTCHFLYRTVERVLESSLVYRGAVPGTSVTKELSDEEPGALTREPLLIEHPSELNMNGQYLVTPAYDGISVKATNSNKKLSITDSMGQALPVEKLKLELTGLKEFSDIPALLVGRRGKERRSVDEIEKFIMAGKGPVSRVELKLYPVVSDGECFSEYGESGSVAAIPYALVTVDQIDLVARKMATRDGVHIWRTSGSSIERSYRYIPKTEEPANRTGFALSVSARTGDALLSFYNETDRRSFIIKQFSLDRFRKGGRYLCDEAPMEKATGKASESCLYNGDLEVVSCEDSFVVQLKGKLDESAVLQPIRINGVRRFLFYRVDPGTIQRQNLEAITIKEDDDVCQE